MAPIEPMIAYVQAADRAGFVGDEAWVPLVLPVQTWRLGELAGAALPVAPTTVAGRRLRRTLQEHTGARFTRLTAYANDYSGYLTTPEEYAMQRYEGGASYIGGGALARMQAILRGELSSENPPGEVDLAQLEAQTAAGRAGSGRPLPLPGLAGPNGPGHAHQDDHRARDLSDGGNV